MNENQILKLLSRKSINASEITHTLKNLGGDMSTGIHIIHMHGFLSGVKITLISVTVVGMVVFVGDKIIATIKTKKKKNTLLKQQKENNECDEYSKHSINTNTEEENTNDETIVYYY